VWFYAAKLIWPTKLTFIYPRWEIDASAAWQYLYPATAAALVATLFVMRKRWGRGPLVAALLFGGTLLPALGFFDVYPMRSSFVADHFQYAASIALIVAVVAGATKILPHRLFTLTGCAFTLLLASLTYHQAKVYRDAGTLWTDTLAKNPDCWMGENNLASFLHDSGDSAGAIEHARRSLAIKPDHAEAYNTLGVVMARLGRTAEAEHNYAAALRSKPKLVAAHMNLGVLLARTGRHADAIGHFQTAAELSPRNVDAVYNWATASLELNRPHDAERLYERALELSPAHAGSHLYLGELMQRDNRLPEAEQHFRAAVKYGPRDARGYDALARLLAASRSPEAIDPAQRACELTNWKDAELIGNLAFACAASGHTAEAALAADRAVQVAQSSGQQKLADEIATWRRSLTSAEATVDTRDATGR
jgi:tetratricopeptide (TPR) repeat protein